MRASNNSSTDDDDDVEEDKSADEEDIPDAALDAAVSAVHNEHEKGDLEMTDVISVEQEVRSQKGVQKTFSFFRGINDSSSSSSNSSVVQSTSRPGDKKAVKAAELQTRFSNIKFSASALQASTSSSSGGVSSSGRSGAKQMATTPASARKQLGALKLKTASVFDTSSDESDSSMSDFNSDGEQEMAAASLKRIVHVPAPAAANKATAMHIDMEEEQQLEAESVVFDDEDSDGESAVSGYKHNATSSLFSNDVDVLGAV